MLRGFLIFLFYTHRQTADEHREREPESLYIDFIFQSVFYWRISIYTVCNIWGNETFTAVLGVSGSIYWYQLIL